MILVNDVEYTDWKKELGDFKMPANGVTFKAITGEPRMHDQMANGNVIGKIPLYPKGVIIPTRCNMELDKVTKSVRWTAQSPTKDEKGNLKFIENDLQFENGTYIVSADLSLYWFLKNHAYNRDSAKSELNQRFFYEENVALETDKKISLKRLKGQATDLLWNGMSDKDVLEMHNAHFKFEASQVGVARLSLEKFAEGEPQKFLDLYKNEVRSIKSILVRAKDKKVIVYDQKTGQWHWPKEAGVTIETADIIMRVTVGDPLDALYKYIDTHDDGKSTLELIEGELSGKVAV